MHSVVGDFEEERLLRVSFDETSRSSVIRSVMYPLTCTGESFSYRSGFPFRLVCW